MKYYIRVTDSHINPKNRLQDECRERMREEFHGTLCADKAAMMEQSTKIIDLKHALERKYNRCKPLRMNERNFDPSEMRYDIWNVSTIEFLPVKRETHANTK